MYNLIVDWSFHQWKETLFMQFNIPALTQFFWSTVWEPYFIFVFIFFFIYLQTFLLICVQLSES